MENLYCRMLAALERGEATTLTTRLSRRDPGELTLTRSLQPGITPQTDARGRRSAVPVLKEEGDGLAFIEPILPPERLVILGGGHVGLALCTLAARCGFSVTVCDDRPEFAAPERFPGTTAVLCRDFVPALEELRLSAYDFIVIVTRGHSHDADCLRAVLRGPETAYVGMIGSHSRVAAQLALLEKEGFPKQRLERVCTPIGLPIGAVTPAEIAVSILAELIAYKRLPDKGNGVHCCNESDLEPELIRALAREKGPCCVATVLSTEGSGPRRAGAKMLVRPDGTLLGSVGGGMVEGVVLRKAREMIGSGKSILMDYDMHGAVAASDAMACGGRMRLLLEDFRSDE